MKSSLKNRMTVHFGLLAVAAVMVLEGLFLIGLWRSWYENAEELTVRQAMLASAHYRRMAAGSLPELAQQVLEETRPENPFDVQVIDLKGRVVTDSWGMPSAEPVLTPDVRDALNGETGIWRGERKDGEEVLAVSLPVTIRERPAGVLRHVTSTRYLDQAFSRIAIISLTVSCAVILLAMIVSRVIAARIVRPIEELTRVAGEISSGNFEARAKPVRGDEIGVLAETMNRMAKELANMEKMKNEFISSVSHELRTPLTVLKGWGETFRLGQLSREDESFGLAVMQKETERLIRLVEDLLDFSKYQSGQMDVQMEPFDLSALVEETVMAFRRLCERKGIRLSRATDGPLMLTGDRSRIKQVLINLLDNSVKFTPEGGRISVKAWRSSGGEICFSVSDTGIGIPAGELDRVMDKFYKGNSGRGGSGLGLAICKEIIRLHGGRMEVESKEGEGTTFTVMLPAEPEGT
ncbi:sensor histidine kinase [Staphylospora marina]|uniref:sensor histidine kinase n=1 Tax=Staphylospora marina TaxID=2490858 RepID=UPI000F5BF980|nr:sensor histidine kinase [Staphylospora marina]